MRRDGFALTEFVKLNSDLTEPGVVGQEARWWEKWGEPGVRGEAGGKSRSASRGRVDEWAVSHSKQGTVKASSRQYLHSW